MLGYQWCSLAQCALAVDIGDSAAEGRPETPGGRPVAGAGARHPACTPKNAARRSILRIGFRIGFLRTNCWHGLCFPRMFFVFLSCPDLFISCPLPSLFHLPCPFFCFSIGSFLLPLSCSAPLPLHLTCLFPLLSPPLLSFPLLFLPALTLPIFSSSFPTISCVSFSSSSHSNCFHFFHVSLLRTTHFDRTTCAMSTSARGPQQLASRQVAAPGLADVQLIPRRRRNGTCSPC